MNESKVYLSSTSLEMANNQNHFTTNPYIELIKEQKETNLHLMDAVSELRKSNQTILNTIQKQEEAFNVQNNSQRHNQLNLENMLLEIALANQRYQAYVDNQERSIRTIMDYLVKQDEFNNLSIAQSNKQDNMLSEIALASQEYQAYVDNQEHSIRTIMDYLVKQDEFNNLSIVQTNKQDKQLLEIALASQGYQAFVDNQERSIRTIMDYLVKQDEFNNLSIVQSNKQDEKLLEIALASQLYQAYVDNQERSIRTIMDYLVKQDEFNKLSIAQSNKQDKVNYQLIRNVRKQTTLLQHQIKRQWNFYETITNRIEENEDYNKTASVKQESHELTNQKMTTKMLVQKSLQREAIQEVKDLLEKMLQEKESISALLSSLPPNYPINQIVVNGATIPLKYFLLLNEETGVAVFSNGIQSMYIPIDKIDAIFLGNEKGRLFH